MWVPSNQVSVIIHMCVNGCGLPIATPTGCCFSCQKIFNGPIRLIFVRWLPSNWKSIINHMWVCQRVRFGHQYTNRKSLCLPKTNLWTNQAEIWYMDSKQPVSIIKNMWVWQWMWLCHNHTHKKSFRLLKAS